MAERDEEIRHIWPIIERYNPLPVVANEEDVFLARDVFLRLGEFNKIAFERLDRLYFEVEQYRTEEPQT